jgi:hypothetical protein
MNESFRNIFPSQDRRLLYERHRLSHQQIDLLLEENLSKEFIREKMKMIDATGHFLSVTDKLREQNIPFIPLKGALLSYRIYGDPAVRFSHDIDLLIEQDHLDHIMEIMMAEGFILREGAFWPENREMRDLIISFSHHISVVNKKTGTCVEFHWTLLDSLPVSHKKLRALVNANLDKITFAGRSFTVINKELEYLYLLIHGSRHAWSRLKWLVDINDYPTGELDREKFSRLAEEMKAGKIISQANALLYTYFNNKTPFDGSKKAPSLFIKKARRYIEGPEIMEASFHDLFRVICYRFLLFPQFRYKIKYLRGIFFRTDDLLKLKSSSEIIYYFYRPYSLIKRRLLNAGQ